jgi:hypothetical protein
MKMHQFVEKRSFPKLEIFDGKVAAGYISLSKTPEAGKSNKAPYRITSSDHPSFEEKGVSGASSIALGKALINRSS